MIQAIEDGTIFSVYYESCVIKFKLDDIVFDQIDTEYSTLVNNSEETGLSKFSDKNYQQLVNAVVIFI